jgi:starch synthase
MVPLFLRKAYKDDILLNNAKIILSLYNDKFDGTFSNTLDKKLLSKSIKAKHIEPLIEKPDYERFVKFAIDYSDGFIFGSKRIGKKIDDYVRNTGKHILEYQDTKNNTQNYADFYDKFL